MTAAAFEAGKRVLAQLPTEEVFSDELCTVWSSWSVVNQWTLVLTLPSLCCTDMNGCIRVARRLLPTVRRVYVITDGRAIVNLYELMFEGWVCSYVGPTP